MRCLRVLFSHPINELPLGSFSISSPRVMNIGWMSTCVILLEKCVCRHSFSRGTLMNHDFELNYLHALWPICSRTESMDELPDLVSESLPTHYPPRLPVLRAQPLDHFPSPSNSAPSFRTSSSPRRLPCSSTQVSQHSSSSKTGPAAHELRRFSSSSGSNN